MKINPISFPNKNIKYHFVDGSELRKDKKFADFSDYGTHLTFPEIPKGEAWIDRHLDKREGKISMLNAWKEIQLSEKKLSKATIADRVQVNDYWLRHHVKGLEPGKDSAIYIKKYVDDKGILPKGIQGWVVHGEAVRQKQGPHASEFIEGGNGYRYPGLIPKHEAWVDADAVPEKEYAHILDHEGYEIGKLRKGEDYDKKAHPEATKHEYEDISKGRTSW